ncbi:MAG: hypothetical protein IV100_19990 [Myxococcales bacterium]|nr:hypothetical protein [Myxococcales bacterium]
MRLIALLFVASFVSACATSLSPTSAASPDAASCADLAWDDCGRAPACRHGRAFDREAAPGGGEILTERFECVPRYTTELVTDATMDIRALVGKPPAAIASLD